MTTENQNKDQNCHNFFVRSQKRCLNQTIGARSNSHYGLNGAKRGNTGERKYERCKIAGLSQSKKRFLALSPTSGLTRTLLNRWRKGVRMSTRPQGLEGVRVVKKFRMLTRSQDCYNGQRLSTFQFNIMFNL